MPVFEVVIIEVPSKTAADEGALETLVLGPTTVVARNGQTAAILASRKMDVPGDPGRMEVIVRPFR